MTSRTKYVVACLSGHGVGPEVMGQASRALARVSHLHGFRVEEIHPPFGAGAFTQSGHALPLETRRATLAAQAILVAAGNSPRSPAWNRSSTSRPASIASASEREGRSRSSAPG